MFYQTGTSLYTLLLLKAEIIPNLSDFHLPIQKKLSIPYTKNFT